MKVCPFCASSKYVVVKTFDLIDLGSRWRRAFKFNPFTEYKGDMLKLRCATCDLTYYDPAIYGESDLYESLSKFSWYYEEDKWEFDEAIEYVIEFKPGSLLEIGCGNGIFLDKVRHLIDKVEGVDINTDALAACKKKGLNVFLPSEEKSQSYDMIVLFEVLEHLEQPAAIISDLVNMLNDGGILIIAVPNPDGYLKGILAPVLLDMPPHHNSSWSEKTFNFLAEKYSFEKIGYATEPLRYVHYISYQLDVMKSFSSSKKSTFSMKIAMNILELLERILLPLRAPYSFTADRKHILGQTHLVVLRKSL